MSFRETLLYRGLEDHVRALMREETVALMNEAHMAQGRLRKGIRAHSKTG